ncbi:hypothetical protein G6F65_011573 [Rhizopus arrhizus]|nr:hypothetical protein G6F65_011573 [Rhizopus arrhizus]
MKTPATDTGRLAQASILAVLAAGMLPAQLVGGLLFALAACGAIAVLLPMALFQQSQHRLRRGRFVWVGFGLAALVMAICTWPGEDSGPLLQRRRYVDTFDVVGYGLLALAAGGFGGVAGLAFHTVFRLSMGGTASAIPATPPGEDA